MRKYYLLTAIVLFCGCLSQAQTISVSGSQSGSWDADTVFVTNNVSVRDSLFIQAGTTVVFQGHYGIRVENGTFIKAIGNETDSITFTVTDTTGFHVYNAGRGGWNGIQLSDARASRFDFCRFEYGKAVRDDDQDGGALRINHCNDVEISNSTLFCNFSREHGGGLNAENSVVKMHDCNVSNNLTYTEIDTVYYMYGGGLRFLKCEVELTDVVFRHNNGRTAIGGAMSIDSCSVRIDRCRFEHNYGINGAGLYMIRCYDNPCSIRNSLFAHNTSGHFGGGFAISDSSPVLSNLTVVDNLSEGVNCGGIFFYQNSSPTLRNCIVYGNLNSVPLEKPVQMWSWTFDDNAPKFYNCLVQYGLENISNYEIITVYENCIDDNPLFVDAENEDYRLAENSPCINAGLTESIDFEMIDLAGNPRVWDGIIDLGAYEHSTVGLHENGQTENAFCIVGNPITPSSYAEIEMNNAANLTASVYSVDGKLLVVNNIGIVNQGLNRVWIGEMFDRLPSGTYMLVLRSAHQSFVAKVIK